MINVKWEKEQQIMDYERREGIDKTTGRSLEKNHGM